MSSRARRTALLAAVALGVLAPASPALATTTSDSGLPHGLYDAEYDVSTTDPAGTTDSVVFGLSYDGASWTFAGYSSHIATSGGAFSIVARTIEPTTLDAGAVSVSPGGSSLTFTTPVLTYTQTDYRGGPTVTTTGTTTATGSFRLAGGDTTASDSWTEKCGSADHHADRIRIADGGMTVFDRSVAARADKNGSGATMAYAQTDGTASC